MQHFVKQAPLAPSPYLAVKAKMENLNSLLCGAEPCRTAASWTSQGSSARLVRLWLWPNWGMPVPGRGTYTPQTTPHTPPLPCTHTPPPKTHTYTHTPTPQTKKPSIHPSASTPPTEQTQTLAIISFLWLKEGLVRTLWPPSDVAGGWCGVMFKDKHYLNCFPNLALIKDWFMLDMPDWVY